MTQPLFHISTHPPHTSSWLLWLAVILGTSACFDPAQPEQAITGLITDDLGNPIEGAVVAHSPNLFTTTGPQGTFDLRSSSETLQGPLTASARGFTAWTLDSSSITRFTARLKPLPSAASTMSTRTITSQIFFEETSLEERFLLVQTDTGAQFPFLLPEGFAQYTLELTATTQTRALLIFTPATLSSPALWSGPLPVRLSTPATAPDILLTPAPVSTLRLPPFSQDAPPPAPTNALLSCTRTRQAPVIAGQDTHLPEQTSSFALDIFPFEDLGTCNLITSYDLSAPPFGDVRHVGFQRDLPPPPNTPDKADALLIPEPHILIPEIDPTQQRARWNHVKEATLYDVFVAQHTEDGALSPALWNGSTSSNSITFPQLPQHALDAMGFDADQRYAIRVVARMVPGLDVDDNWDWSTYYGYISSPWVEIPSEALGWP